MGVKLDKEIRERLKALGEKKERSPHWLMTRAIQEYLDREEAYEREKQEDLLRWQQYLDTGEYVGHDTVKDRLTDLAAKARRQAKAAG
jgi:predicted transcriptional regulator